MAASKHNLNDLRADVQRDVDALRSVRNEIKFAPTAVKATATTTSTAATTPTSASSPPRPPQ